MLKLENALSSATSPKFLLKLTEELHKNMLVFHKQAADAELKKDKYRSLEKMIVCKILNASVSLKAPRPIEFLFDHYSAYMPIDLIIQLRDSLPVEETPCRKTLEWGMRRKVRLELMDLLKNGRALGPALQKLPLHEADLNEYLPNLFSNLFKEAVAMGDVMAAMTLLHHTMNGKTIIRPASENNANVTLKVATVADFTKLVHLALTCQNRTQILAMLFDYDKRHHDSYALNPADFTLLLQADEGIDPLQNEVFGNTIYVLPKLCKPSFPFHILHTSSITGKMMVSCDSKMLVKNERDMLGLGRVAITCETKEEQAQALCSLPGVTVEPKENDPAKLLVTFPESMRSKISAIADQWNEVSETYRQNMLPQRETPPTRPVLWKDLHQVTNVDFGPVPEAFKEHEEAWEALVALMPFYQEILVSLIIYSPIKIVFGLEDGQIPTSHDPFRGFAKSVYAVSTFTDVLCAEKRPIPADIVKHILSYYFETVQDHIAKSDLPQRWKNDGARHYRSSSRKLPIELSKMPQNAEWKKYIQDELAKASIASDREQIARSKADPTLPFLPPFVLVKDQRFEIQETAELWQCIRQLQEAENNLDPLTQTLLTSSKEVRLSLYKIAAYTQCLSAPISLFIMQTLNPQPGKNLHNAITQLKSSAWKEEKEMLKDNINKLTDYERAKLTQLIFIPSILSLDAALFVGNTLAPKADVVISGENYIHELPLLYVHYLSLLQHSSYFCSNAAIDNARIKINIKYNTNETHETVRQHIVGTFLNVLRDSMKFGDALNEAQLHALFAEETPFVLANWDQQLALTLHIQTKVFQYMNIDPAHPQIGSNFSKQHPASNIIQIFALHNNSIADAPTFQKWLDITVSYPIFQAWANDKSTFHDGLWSHLLALVTHYDTYELMEGLLLNYGNLMPWETLDWKAIMKLQPELTYTLYRLVEFAFSRTLPPLGREAIANWETSCQIKLLHELETPLAHLTSLLYDRWRQGEGLIKIFKTSNLSSNLSLVASYFLSSLIKQGYLTNSIFLVQRFLNDKKLFFSQPFGNPEAPGLWLATIQDFEDLVFMAIASEHRKPYLKLLNNYYQAHSEDFLQSEAVAILARHEEALISPPKGTLHILIPQGMHCEKAEVILNCGKHGTLVAINDSDFTLEERKRLSIKKLKITCEEPTMQKLALQTIVGVTVVEGSSHNEIFVYLPDNKSKIVEQIVKGWKDIDPLYRELLSEVLLPTASPQLTTQKQTSQEMSKTL